MIMAVEKYQKNAKVFLKENQKYFGFSDKTTTSNNLGLGFQFCKQG